jgi:hypothetical protein
VKIKFEELESVCSVNPISVVEIKEGSVPLAFYKEEVPGESKNYQIPLLVRARMANFDVRGFWSTKEVRATSCTMDCSKLFSSQKKTCHHMSVLIFRDSMELQQSLGGIPT